MQYRTLARTNIPLSAIGLGCMVINHGYGTPDEKEGIKVLEEAIDLGINFWDTADIYADGRNEELIGRILPANRDKVFIATKFGFRAYADGKPGGLDCSPAYIKVAVEHSLKRLKTDVIDLYYAHRIDPNVPVEETVGAMADLVSLPGVGRKTANVVRSVALGLPGLPVDTHVLRLTKRLGIIEPTDTDPVKVELLLNPMVPEAERGEFSLRIILHGRRVCFARKPNCGGCALADFCPSAGAA